MCVDATFARITFSNILIIDHSPSDYRPGTASVSGKCGIINPRRACAARVTVLGLSVCLSVHRLANLAVQGMGRPMTITNRFRVARSLILIGRFS